MDSTLRLYTSGKKCSWDMHTRHTETIESTIERSKCMDSRGVVVLDDLRIDTLAMLSE